MNDFDSEGGSEYDWEDRGDLAWNEFDWERYLREQDEAVERYLRYYQASKGGEDRLDEVAEKMNWNHGDWIDDDDLEDEGDSSDDREEFDQTQEVYTLHKNPIFIATKAIHLGLARSWRKLGSDVSRVPPALSMAMLASMHASEDQAVQAIHALDFGDYAMAVSLFKRALAALNGTFSLLAPERIARCPSVLRWREQSISQLFDLREIWLRVMSECRQALQRPLDEES